MISKATGSDIRELNALVNSAYRGESSKQGWTTEADLLDGIRVDEERLKEIIEKPGSMILKLTDAQKQIIGCVHLEMKENKLYHGMLTVNPKLQSRGTGKQLLAAAEDEGRKLNCTAIFMTVIESRTELIKWYQRHGYSITNERKPFPMDDPRFGFPKRELVFIVMEKRIQ